jgi:formylglycine-generating enzyme required for sulfatase activity
VNHYELLDVSPGATQDDIKAAYRILVQLYHPDRLQHANEKVRQYAEERLKKINAAYTVLSDPVRRADYDARQRVSERADGDLEGDDYFDWRPQRGTGRRKRGVDPDMEAAADEWLRRAAQAEAEARAAERAEARQRRAAEEAERQRKDSEERARRAAQNAYPRVREQEQGGLTLAFAPGLWTTLLRIPEGEFCMGSDPARDALALPPEQPQHRVWLTEYFIGQYPVTNAQYHVFLQATQPNVGHPLLLGQENHPVVNVSWDDANAFCHWLTRMVGRKIRLPTEAEWEKAARGAEGRLYPWGDEWDVTRLNADRTAQRGDVVAVGQFSPAGDSVFGVADMGGNVWEWCADWYDANFYMSRIGYRVVNPAGPGGGEGCVVRGGAFDSSAKHARCAHRNWHYPYKKRPNLGFRIAAEPLPPE